MSQEIRVRTQKIIEYSANGKVSESLSRGMVYREIAVRLQGQLTVTAANNTQAKTLRGDELACVKNIRLIANNTQVIRDFDLNFLWWLNFFMYNSMPRVTSTLGDAATANPAFDTVLILPLWMPQSSKPLDTALDSRILSDLKVEVQWGTYTDINADATGWTVNPTVEIGSLESFNVAGPFALWRTWKMSQEITATNSKFQMKLPVNNVYRGFFLNFTDANVDDGDVLNNFIWQSGPTVYADLPGDTLHQLTLARKGLPRMFNGQTYDDLRIGTANSLNGWYFYDHVTDGYLTEGLDTLGFSEIELQLDVTKGGGTTVVNVYPIEIIPVRGGK